MATETSIVDSTKPLLIDFQLIGNLNKVCIIVFINKFLNHILDTEHFLSILQSNCFKAYEKKEKELRHKMKELRVLRGIL